MSPPFRRGIFVLERCGACSGKSAETKMEESEASGHHFDLASPIWDHRVTRSVPVIPPSPQVLVKTEKLKERKPVTTHVCWLFHFYSPLVLPPFSMHLSE